MRLLGVWQTDQAVLDKTRLVRQDDYIPMLHENLSLFHHHPNRKTRKSPTNGEVCRSER